MVQHVCYAMWAPDNALRQACPQLHGPQTLCNVHAHMHVSPCGSLTVQMYKVFVLGRVNIKALKALPGLQTDSSNASTSGGASLASASDHELLLHPPGSSIVNSNVYSVAEGCLLAWLTHHYVREFGPKAKRCVAPHDHTRRTHTGLCCKATSAHQTVPPSCTVSCSFRHTYDSTLF